jgi:hypothetical protein
MRRRAPEAHRDDLGTLEIPNMRARQAKHLEPKRRTAFEAMIGFNGKTPVSSRQFADAVVRRLAAHWKPDEVPKSRGALPLVKCG